MGKSVHCVEAIYDVRGVGAIMNTGNVGRELRPNAATMVVSIVLNLEDELSTDRLWKFKKSE